MFHHTTSKQFSFFGPNNYRHMLTPTKPNGQRKQETTNFIWEQFAKSCLLNKYALVVGSEVVLNKEDAPESEGDSTKLLFERTLYHIAYKNLEEEYDSDQSVTEEKIFDEYQHLKRRHENFTQLVKKYHGVKDIVWKVTKQLIEDNTQADLINSIDPDLLQLLETRCFRIVITTAVDPFLELAMQKVWGKDGFDIIHVDNAKPSFKQIEYDEFNVTRPILCYMFGKVDISKSSIENNFVLSENQAIEKIANWFNEADSNGFLKFVRNYNILSVGPKFDDWMFRFFWYLLRGEIGKSSGCQQVAVEINRGEQGPANYLESQNVKVFDDARDFMRNAVGQIQSAISSLRLPRKDQGVFISYSHKDKYIALPLFEKLRSAGIPVWIDDAELDDGDVFKERIAEAISKCRIFLPILSTSIAEQINSRTMEEQWYYQNEWCLINERYNEERRKLEEIRKLNDSSHPIPSLKIIPFVVGKYDYSKDYHKLVPDCIKEASINDSFVLATDKVEHLLEIINRQ